MHGWEHSSHAYAAALTHTLSLQRRPQPASPCQILPQRHTLSAPDAPAPNDLPYMRSMRPLGEPAPPAQCPRVDALPTNPSQRRGWVALLHGEPGRLGSSSGLCTHLVHDLIVGHPVQDTGDVHHLLAPRLCAGQLPRGHPAGRELVRYVSRHA